MLQCQPLNQAVLPMEWVLHPRVRHLHHRHRVHLLRQVRHRHHQVGHQACHMHSYQMVAPVTQSKQDFDMTRSLVHVHAQILSVSPTLVSRTKGTVPGIHRQRFGST